MVQLRSNAAFWSFVKKRLLVGNFVMEERCERSAVRDPEFVIRVVEVYLYGTVGDVDGPCDLFIGHSHRDEACNLPLAWGQTRCTDRPTGRERENVDYPAFTRCILRSGTRRDQRAAREEGPVPEALRRGDLLACWSCA